MTLGERIRDLRCEKGLSQRALGRACGVSQGTISLIEKDAISPSTETISQIATGLNTSVAALIGEQDISHKAAITDADIKFALFGGDGNITDAQLEEVKRYARYIREREAGDK